MNEALVEHLSRMKGREDRAIAEIVREIAEVDRLQSYREAGYSSLFSLMTVGLGYSEGSAYRRIQAARCLESPGVYEMLQGGKVSLCALSEISRVKEPEHRDELLREAPGKSKIEVQKLASRYLPVERPKRETVRVKQVELPPAPLFEAKEQPSSPVRSYTVTLEVTDEFMKLLNEAKRFTGPVGNSRVIEQALRSFLSQKTAPVKRKMNRSSRAKGRSIPKEIREAVRERDQNRCMFMSTLGIRCCETRSLQFDHKIPFAKGGKSTMDNLRLLCPNHNRLESERHFGKQCVRNHFHRDAADGSPLKEVPKGNPPLIGVRLEEL